MSPKPPADLALEPNCLCFKVRRAARAVSQHYDRALGQHGLSAPQFSLLSVLAQAGLRSLSELAKLTTTDRTTLNRNLGLLEERGLVESAPGVDKRTRRFVLTPTGRRLQAAARGDWLVVQAGLEEALGGAKVQRLLSDLDSLLAGVARLDDPAELTS
ncbi:MAG: MarR family winged helix-turn-helix transcriptional regulator [Planctomycetota bacterium]|nr:MarR family winged helix-turn-helix transcriptional regulator [Planctomycetota bacterium]